jgi:hypothetical protein
MTYTLDEIKFAWKQYERKQVLRTYRDGKWSYQELNGKPLPRVQGVRAEVVKYSTVMSFPTYLETKCLKA